MGYTRITNEMTEFRQQRSAFTQAEFKRKDTLARVREIEKMLRGKEIVKEFDEELFAALVDVFSLFCLSYFLGSL